MFPDDATAECWFIEKRWQGSLSCHHCGSTNVQAGAKHETMPFRCRDCRKRSSVRTGTMMQSSKLGYQTWAIAIYLLTSSPKRVSSIRLHKDLNITQKSAWHLAYRLRETWRPRPRSVRRASGRGIEPSLVARQNARRAQREHTVGRGGVDDIRIAGTRDGATKRARVRPVDHIEERALGRFRLDGHRTVLAPHSPVAKRSPSEGYS